MTSVRPQVKVLYLSIVLFFVKTIKNLGYIGNGTECEDSNECEENSKGPKCDVYEDCINSPGNFSCVCKKGFVTRKD